MTPRQIKSLLAKKNITQTAIAKRCRVSVNSVHLFIHGKSRSARIERHLAKSLGITVEQLRGVLVRNKEEQAA